MLNLEKHSQHVETTIEPKVKVNLRGETTLAPPIELLLVVFRLSCCNMGKQNELQKKKNLRGDIGNTVEVELVADEVDWFAS
jgi:hypothetical protein